VYEALARHPQAPWPRLGLLAHGAGSLATTKWIVTLAFMACGRHAFAPGQFSVFPAGALALVSGVHLVRKRFCTTRFGRRFWIDSVVL